MPRKVSRSIPLAGDAGHWTVTEPWTVRCESHGTFRRVFPALDQAALAITWFHPKVAAAHNGCCRHAVSSCAHAAAAALQQPLLQLVESTHRHCGIGSDQKWRSLFNPKMVKQGPRAQRGSFRFGLTACCRTRSDSHKKSVHGCTCLLTEITVVSSRVTGGWWRW